MTIFETIEAGLLRMPQQPLTREAHGPCMNCSFENERLTEFYRGLFEVMSPETYSRLDKEIIRRMRLTGYDHFLPRYNLPARDFQDTMKNVFWCFKMELFLAVLREVLGDRVGPGERAAGE
jgi:hypothetical protein